MLDGSLVRSAAGLELSATLRRTDGAGGAVHAEASGSPDSLPALVDRLAAGLLAGQTGAMPSLGALSSARALTAYLRGKAADRQGRYQDAVAAYGEALAEDSGFALAALDQVASSQRFGDTETSARAARLAWTHRERLTPKGRILLRAMVGPRYPESSSMIASIAAWQEAVKAAPELPEAWFELGDIQLHYGGTNDLPDPVARSEENFRRALELDPTWVLPLDHILLAKLYLEDTTEFRALARRWLAQDTVPGDRSPYLRWRLGVALGDSALVARERAGLERWGDDAVLWLAGNAQADARALNSVVCPGRFWRGGCDRVEGLQCGSSSSARRKFSSERATGSARCVRPAIVQLDIAELEPGLGPPGAAWTASCRRGDGRDHQRGGGCLGPTIARSRMRPLGAGGVRRGAPRGRSSRCRRTAGTTPPGWSSAASAKPSLGKAPPRRRRRHPGTSLAVHHLAPEGARWGVEQEDGGPRPVCPADSAAASRSTSAGSESGLRELSLGAARRRPRHRYSGGSRSNSRPAAERTRLPVRSPARPGAPGRGVCVHQAEIRCTAPGR